MAEFNTRLAESVLWFSSLEGVERVAFFEHGASGFFGRATGVDAL
jgi:hypothetical protein